MEQYINKSALVAEIKNRRDSFYSLSKSCEKGTPAKAGFYAQAQTLEGILSFLDTLETKEVCLKKDFELTWEDVAWIVNKAILLCKVESILTAEDICKETLKQFKAQKGE